MGAMPETVSRGRGRPRDPAKDAAICDAAWEILADKGYEGMSFEAVAGRAGISRATLYRRFASKIELTEHVLHETSRAIEVSMSVGDDPRAALIAHSTGCAEYMSGVRGRANLSLMESATRIPELDEVILRHTAAERALYYREFEKIAPRAAESDKSFVFDTLVGSVIYHVAIRRRKLCYDDIAALVDQASSCLLQRERRYP